MIQLNAFRAPIQEAAEYKNIPIGHLAEVRALLKQTHPRVRFAFRFRGPRNHPLDTRCYGRRMQDARKAFANRFAVYVRKTV